MATFEFEQDRVTLRRQAQKLNFKLSSLSRHLQDRKWTTNYNDPHGIGANKVKIVKHSFALICRRTQGPTIWIQLWIFLPIESDGCWQ